MTGIFSQKEKVKINSGLHFHFNTSVQSGKSEFHISFQDFTGGNLPEMCSIFLVSLICPRCNSVTAHSLFSIDLSI